jgi:hypothetical protein
MSGAGRWVKDNPLASLGILAATVATAGAAAPALGAGAAAGAAAVPATGLLGGAAELASVGATGGTMLGGSQLPAAALLGGGGAAELASVGEAGGSLLGGASPASATVLPGDWGGALDMMTRMKHGLGNKATRMGMQMMSDSQEQQQPMPMDPRQQMPAQQQQPLGIPGGYDDMPMDVNSGMTEEERKWRMLLAQLQGASQ